jgi:four helix bundle protein
MKQSIIKDKSFAFALKSIDLYYQLTEIKEFIISKQFLRAATSIGANVNEALAAESKADFAHKMSIVSKEARETLYWLELLELSDRFSLNVELYIYDCKEIIKIVTSIVKTTKVNSLKI